MIPRIPGLLALLVLLLASQAAVPAQGAQSPSSMMQLFDDGTGHFLQEAAGVETRRVPFTPWGPRHLRRDVDAAGKIMFLPDDFSEVPKDSLGIALDVHAARKRNELPNCYVDRDPDGGWVLPGPFLEPGEEGRRVNITMRALAPPVWRGVSEVFAVSPDAQIEFSVGLCVQDARRPPGTCQIRVEAILEDRTEVLLTESMEIRVDTPRVWSDRTISLAHLAGERIRVAFALITEDSSKALPAIPVFGDPVVYVASAPRKADDPPSILLVQLDTLRADRLGCYGYSRPTSPNLDRFAKDAVLFEQCITASPWTSPSVASVFTGLHPATHKAGIWSEGYRLRPEYETLSEVAHRRGYLTAAYAEGAAILAGLGYSQGFSRYSNGESPTQHVMGRIESTLANAEAWLTRFGRHRYFLYVQTYEIHDPYGAPEPWATQFTGEGPRPGGISLWQVQTDEDRAYARNAYDSGIAYTDDRVGAWLERLQRAGLLENTVVVFFSDHGEELWEHGAGGHTSQIWEEVLWVPLIIRFPGAAAPQGRIARMVALHDIFATLSDLMGGPKAPPTSTSLLPLIDPERWPGIYDRTDIVSQQLQMLEYDDMGDGSNAEWTMHSMRTHGEKYIRSDREAMYEAAQGKPYVDRSTLGPVKEMLFDLVRDPKERHDRASSAPMRTKELGDYVDKFLREHAGEAAKASGTPAAPLHQEALEQLEALGYLGATPQQAAPK